MFGSASASPSAARSRRIVSAMLYIGVIAASCTANDGTSRRSASTGGISPVRVGNVVACPGSAVPARGRSFFPPNFPAEDEPSPDRCFDTVADARAAGLSAAPAPAGGRLIGGIYLVPVESDLRSSCVLGARRLGFPVACPSLLPAPGTVVNAEATVGRLGFRDLPIEVVFPGPPGYVGAPNLSSPGRPVGHAWVESYRGPRQDQQCPGGKTVGHRSLPGIAAPWISCPAGMATDSGHIVLQWTENGVRYDVSIHGHTRLNRYLAVAIARDVTLVG